MPPPPRRSRSRRPGRRDSTHPIKRGGTSAVGGARKSASTSTYFLPKYSVLSRRPEAGRPASAARSSDHAKLTPADFTFAQSLQGDLGADPKQDRQLLRLMGLSRGRSSTPRQWRTVSLDSALASKQREGDHHDETDAGHAPARQFKEAHQGPRRGPCPATTYIGNPSSGNLSPGSGIDDRGYAERGSCHAPNAYWRCISDGYDHGPHIPGRGRVLRPSLDVLSARSTDGPAGPADR